MTDTNTAEREAFIKWMGAEASTSAAESIWSRDEMLARAFKAGRASLAASAGSEPSAQLAAERDELFQAAIDFIRTLTGMEPPPIEVAPPDVFAPFREFVNTVQTITDKRPPSPPEGMAGWKNIATAPEKGIFLVYMPTADRDGDRIQVAVWHPNVKVVGNLFAFDCAPITHWMPLPAPPLPASEEKEL